MKELDCCNLELILRGDQGTNPNVGIILSHSPYFKFLRNWLGVCPVTLRKVRLNELLLE